MEPAAVASVVSASHGWDSASIATVIAAVLVTMGAIYVGIRTIHAQRKALDDTVEANQKTLNQQLAFERDAARSSLDQARRERAYVQLVRYANWVNRTTITDVGILSRRMIAAAEAKGSGISHWAAFAGVQLTKQEEALYLRGPTDRQNDLTEAISTVFSSAAMKDAFTKLLDRTKEFRSASNRLTELMQQWDTLPDLNDPSRVAYLKEDYAVHEKHTIAKTEAENAIAPAMHAVTDAVKALRQVARLELTETPQPPHGPAQTPQNPAPLNPSP
jgi:hypothetical protein